MPVVPNNTIAANSPGLRENSALTLSSNTSAVKIKIPICAAATMGVATRASEPKLAACGCANSHTIASAQPSTPKTFAVAMRADCALLRSQPRSTTRISSETISRIVSGSVMVNRSP